MKTGIHYFFKAFLLLATSFFASSCGPQKDTVANRGMQNLTARYNILYNARILVDESERNILSSYRDNYDRLIPVYKEPTEELSQPELKNLDKAIEKANVIINEKDQSQYVDDAYLLIAKAHHLKAQYFDASEFFGYLYKSYPLEKEKQQAALAWKARSLIALGRFDEAESTLDTAFKYLRSARKSVADVYATRAQLHIQAQEDSLAIELLQKAVQATDDKQLAIRWQYLLGQLHELNGKKEDANQYYTAVVKSNAPFDMAFNAKLNRIALAAGRSDTHEQRIEKLRDMLKDDKNKQFIDQIYHEIGNAYAQLGNQQLAVEAFNQAVRQSTGNAEQKGLAYLSLAELFLKDGRYAETKKYYDSTLTVLPKDHPEYTVVSRKASNLDLLTDRLSIISKEDTLQMLARLPADEREKRIGILVQNNVEKTLGEQAAAGPGLNTPFTDQPQTGNTTKDGKFYFNNSLALSQGFSDFKKRWGNRKLEDNWRRSQRSSAETINNATLSGLNPDAPASLKTETSNTGSPTGSLRQAYLRDLPLTAAQLAASNRKIESAYFDLANFYKDILADRQQAIETYEHLLNRFPESEHKLPVYYNLYRLYLDTDVRKAEEFKTIILTKYPETPFAKAILDPDYDQKMSEQEVALARAYDEVYDLYLNKKYNEVLAQISQLQQKYGRNEFSAQLGYLSVLAIGHTRKLNEFEAALRDLIASNPEDPLVTPLAKQHLIYVDTHREALSKRPFALMDFDPNEPRFVEEPEPQNIIADRTTAAPPSPQPEKAAIAETKPEDPAEKPASVVQEQNPFGFTQNDSTQYYFVVNVLDPRVNLSSSRFGIGQFNRSNYPPNAIKHQLKAINNQNQLIFVGLFNSKEAAKTYYDRIMPLMNKIMKIPADRFNTFIITGENLDRLTDRTAVEKYIEYYHNTY